MTLLRRVLVLSSLVFAVACNNSDNNGKNDLAETPLDFAGPPSDMSITDLAGADMTSPGTCTVINVWPAVTPAAFFDGTATTAYGFDTAATPNNVLSITDENPQGATAAANTETYTSASNSTTCEVCAQLYTTCDASGNCDKVFLPVSGTASSKADAADVGEIIASGRNLMFLEWDTTNDVALAGGACYVVNMVDYDVNFSNPTDGGTATGSALFFFGKFVSSAANNFGSRAYPPGTTNTTIALPTVLDTAWDVSVDGYADLVYASDTGTAGTDSLYYSASDGSGAMAIQTPDHTGRKYTRALWSPDGNTVAFYSDDSTGQATDDGAGAFDIYINDFFISGTTTKISPARPTGAGTTARNTYNVDVMSWSPDNAYLAFTGDFSTDHAFQLYVWDVNNAVLKTIIAPTDIYSGTAPTADTGCNGAMLNWDSSDNLYFTCKLLDGNFRLYSSDPSAASPTHAQLAGTFTTGEQIGSYGITPDGNTIVFSSTDATGAFPYMLYSMPLGTTTKTPIFAASYTPTNAAAGNPDFSKPLVFSPDGNNIVFVADYEAGNAVYELFIVAMGGNATPVRLFNMTAHPTRDAKWAAFNTAGDTLFFSSDYDGSATGNSTLYSTTDFTTADQTLTPLITLPAGAGLAASISPFRWVDILF